MPSQQRVIYPQFQQHQPQQYFVQHYSSQQQPQQQKVQLTNIPNNVKPIIIIKQQQKQSQLRPNNGLISIKTSQQIASAILPSKLPEKSSSKLEFDLPPPPPSQFLPDNELDKIKIAELFAQQHRQQSRQTIIKSETQIQQKQVLFL